MDGVVWLRKEAIDHDVDRLLGMGGRDHDLRIRKLCPDDLRQRVPVDRARHSDVCYEDVDSRIILKDVQSLRRVCCLDDVVTCRAKVISQTQANERFVLDHED